MLGFVGQHRVFMHAKVGKNKLGTPTPTYKGLKEFSSNNHVATKNVFLCRWHQLLHEGKARRSGCLIGQILWLCGQWSLEQTFYGRKILHWRTHVFNYNNRRPCHCVVWVQMPNLSIPWSHFCVLANLNAHPDTKFTKAVCHNTAAPFQIIGINGERITYGWVLCGENDCHPIPWIWLHDNHSVQWGEDLACFHCR